MVNQSTDMGLVEYIGTKIASFTVTYKPGQGRSVNRMWAAVSNERSRMVKKRRWLPRPEALFYNALPDFRILRWGTSIAPQTSRVPVSSITAFSDPIPESQALPLEVLLRQQAAAMLKTAPSESVVTKEEEIKPTPTFVMSGSGLAHAPDCGSALRIKEPKKFYTMEDVISDPDFKKWHKCCNGVV